MINEALNCNMCQLLCCKYAQRGQFQVIEVILLNVELGRDAK